MLQLSIKLAIDLHHPFYLETYPKPKYSRIVLGGLGISKLHNSLQISVTIMFD
jgi:hypothetical protein